MSVTFHEGLIFAVEYVPIGSAVCQQSADCLEPCLTKRGIVGQMCKNLWGN